MIWISIDEKLPKEYENVLIYSFDSINIGYFDGKSFDGGYGDYIPNVTHWMPLPEKPIKK